MLEPRGRRLLLDALRPPEGYTLDHAVGTTYSLDLLALLTAPLAFSLFEAEDAPDGTERIDPLALLTALRRHAGRITLFCESGRIAVPARHQPLFGYLEDAVFQATAPNSGFAFHPKLWVLRFQAKDEAVLYRVLCLTRNLTFDRSWDTALVLEGELGTRTTAIALNRPLSEFVSSLPGLASPSLSSERAAALARIAEEVRRVKFAPPDGMELVGFWPLGIRGHTRWPFEGRIDRLLVVSPFLAPGRLRQLASDKTGCVLVSRPDTLMAMPPDSLSNFDRVFQLNPFADADGEPGCENAVPSETLSGLHAKVYVADAGWDARIWTGSANATDAAFAGNVEFLVELKGKKSQCGIDVVMGEGRGGDSFGQLLQRFTQPAGGGPSPEELRLDRVLDEARRALACAGLRAVLTALEEAGEFRVELVPDSDNFSLPVGVVARCRPVSVPDAASRPVEPGAEPIAIFERLSAAAITSFFAFTLDFTDGGSTASTQFVLNLPLDGAPEDRRDAILIQLLRDRGMVMRLIRLLLAESGADAAALLHGWAGGGEKEAGNRGSGGVEVPLFETLVRALDRNPARLDEISRLVVELGRTAAGRELLPEGFLTVWEPIWATRLELP